MAKAKKKVEEEVPSDELKQEQQKFAKMMVYVEQTEHKLAAAIAKAEEFRIEMDKQTAEKKAERQEKLDALRERDAYKKAKAENDERFMRERDEARANVEALEIQIRASEETLKLVAKERDEARAEVEVLQKANSKLVDDLQFAQAALQQKLSPAESCKEERAAGNGGCGACAICCKELKDKLNTVAILSGVLGEVQAERVRQDAKWGEQNHPDGTCAEGQAKAKAHADSARNICNHFAKIGKLTWAHIFSEEMMEAYAETDPVKLEKEIIQTCAVGVAWVECIRRRQHGRTG